jgi:hypothetical protein
MMTLLEALLGQRRFYKTDKNYVFTIDKPSSTKAAVVGGALGGAKGALTGLGGAHIGKWGGTKLTTKAAAIATPGIKKKALELAAKATSGIGKFASNKAGKIVVGGVGLGAGIPMGAAIGHAMAKRKLKYADPYVQGILDKVKGQEIKRKQYKNLLKGQQAISVSAHRLFPTSGGK